MIVIGSHAARYWLPDFREPTDVDLIGTMSQIATWAAGQGDRLVSIAPSRNNPKKLVGRLKDGTPFEVEIATAGSSGAMLIETAATKGWPEIDLPTGRARVVDADHLYLIKRAHAYWPIHWRKTMEDIVCLKSVCDPVSLDAAKSFYDLRLAENEEKHGKRFRAKLNVANEAFFARSETAVQRQIDHDSLHEIVAYGDRPLYETYKRDLSKASLDRDLFEAAPMGDRLRLVREETMVIAAERYLIPGHLTDPSEAYSKALQRICTNLTSGWFRDFAIDHWGEIREPDVYFWRRIVG